MGTDGGTYLWARAHGPTSGWRLHCFESGRPSLMTPLVSRSCCSEGRQDCKPAGGTTVYLGDTWIWERAWTVPVRHSASPLRLWGDDAARMTLVDTGLPRCPLSSAEGSRRSTCPRRRPQEPVRLAVFATGRGSRP
jgi:hypothetical protein